MPVTLVKAGAAAALIGLAAGVGGYFYGHRQGDLAAQAKHNRAVVDSLTGVIESHKGLIAEANQASLSMRAARNRRAADDARTTKELRDALNATAAARADCDIDDRSMQHLTTAAARAAKAAAGGVRHTVPDERAGAAGPHP